MSWKSRCMLPGPGFYRLNPTFGNYFPSVMKSFPSLLAISSVLSLLGPSAAHAEDIALSFDLPPADSTVAVLAPSPQPEHNGQDLAAISSEPEASAQPLPVPDRAANPPVQSQIASQIPAGVNPHGVGPLVVADGWLPPPDPPPTPVIVAQATLNSDPLQSATPVAGHPPAAAQLSTADADLGVLMFDLVPTPAEILTAKAAATPSPAPVVNSLPTLFVGASDSLVARAVGSAEGTRTPDGALTQAYYGHTDPGNQVWNMGTFSYQHGAKTPEEADQRQLNRLQAQSQVLKQRAQAQGLNLTLEETLNGIDLANQSPLAAIGKVGYIERLAEARQLGMTGNEAIVWARTRSYLNPDTKRWNAPGLGNNLNSITRDQQRRANAIAKALDVYQHENTEFAAAAWSLDPPAPSPAAAVDAAQPKTPTVPSSKPEPVDGSFQLWSETLHSEPPQAGSEQSLTSTLIPNRVQPPTPTSTSPSTLTEANTEGTKPSVGLVHAGSSASQSAAIPEKLRLERHRMLDQLFQINVQGKSDQRPERLEQAPMPNLEGPPGPDSSSLSPPQGLNSSQPSDQSQDWSGAVPITKVFVPESAISAPPQPGPTLTTTSARFNSASDTEALPARIPTDPAATVPANHRFD